MLFMALLLLLSPAMQLAGQVKLPDNMYLDTVYSPFYYGVASGDPLQTKVIIWTKIFLSNNTSEPIPLKWQVSKDSSFTSLVRSGETNCLPIHDFTTQVDVDGLQPSRQYFYRFMTQDGKVSQTGRAQTLPDDSVKHFKIALVSCAGAWSGYFNAYRRMGERADIDFIVHVGDYIYDDVDPDEHIRMPVPPPQTTVTLADWRERHKYYLLDPDLRYARQNKTWIVEWDNHDTHYNVNEKNADGIKAFYEYVPIRMPDTLHPERIYRSFHFGTLADLDMIDMYLFRGKEEFAPGQKSILGNLQDQWFKTELKRSTARWHLIGNQEMMGSWISKGIPHSFHLPGNGTYFDPEDWDGYVTDRNRLYHFLDSCHIDNFMALTGDLHMSFIIDLTPDPQNRKVYKRLTGHGAVGVEVLTPSLSAGNFDVEHVPHFLVPLIQRICRDINPHHRWVNFIKHGYTTIDVTPERCTTEFWYSDITRKTDIETFGRGFIVKNGKNHWERKSYKKQSRLDKRTR